MNDIKWLKIDWDKDELSARGTQIKIELNLKDSDPITSEQLKYMKEKFSTLKIQDNNLYTLLNSITDFDSAADWFSKHSYPFQLVYTLLNYDFIKCPFGFKGL